MFVAKVVYVRSNYLNAALVALMWGAVFLPAPFISVGTSASDPPAADTTESSVMWPVAEGEKQEKVLFEAKVAEIAKRRDVKNPPAKQGVVPEWLVWVVAGVGLLTVILVLFLGRIRLPKRAKRTGGSGKDISVITQIDRAD